MYLLVEIFIILLSGGILFVEILIVCIGRFIEIYLVLIM